MIADCIEAVKNENAEPWCSRPFETPMLTSHKSLVTQSLARGRCMSTSSPALHQCLGSHWAFACQRMFNPDLPAHIQLCKASSLPIAKKAC